MNWYQQLPQIINPVAVSFGVMEIRWYAVAWVVALGSMWALLSWRVRAGEAMRKKGTGLINADFVDDLVFWGLVGGLVGGRIGYGLIYDFAQTVSNPISLIAPLNSAGEWIGIAGMSFHGGLIGVVVALLLLTRKHQMRPLALSDFIVPVLPIISLIGRVGNFLNHELYGRITQVPWGMNFAHIGDTAGVLRHPSQLYQAVLEGGLLLAVLWFLRNRLARWHGALTAVYLVGYGLARFVVEFWRMPDAQIGFVWGSLTMGQVLSLAMIIGGLCIIDKVWYTEVIRKDIKKK